MQRGQLGMCCCRTRGESDPHGWGLVARLLVLLAMAVVVCGSGRIAAAQVKPVSHELRSALWKLAEIPGKGLPDSGEHIDRRLESLLEKHPDAGDQGRLYVAALKAQVLSRGGSADLAITYAETADWLPLDPIDKSQLYQTWADAVWWRHEQGDGAESVAACEAAATLYLKSLKVALDSGIPEQVPAWEDLYEAAMRGELPQGPVHVMAKRWAVSLESLARAKQDDRELHWSLAAQFEEQTTLEYVSEMTRIRDRSRESLARLCATEPFDIAQLRELADGILGSAKAATELAETVQQRITARTSETMPDALPRCSPGTFADPPSAIRVGMTLTDVIARLERYGARRFITSSVPGQSPGPLGETLPWFRVLKSYVLPDGTWLDIYARRPGYAAGGWAADPDLAYHVTGFAVGERGVDYTLKHKTSEGKYTYLESLDVTDFRGSLLWGYFWRGFWYWVPLLLVLLIGAIVYARRRLKKRMAGRRPGQTG